MADFHPATGTVRFGAFELDSKASELRKQGSKVKLQEQPFQILQVLVQRPGETVTREELQQKIWPSDTFVDFDHGLYNAIKRLREALGDDAEKPQYIETLPRRGYRFIGKSEVVPPAVTSRIQSLAVLPLENLSRDPEQEYFAEGLTEALITTLAKIGELRVVSRTSVMQYKGIHKALRDIARELEVDAIVEGTVLRAGERVRISAQLIDASADRHLWAESYERDPRDVLALQAEVAQAIARQVRVKLTPLDQARFAEVRAVDPDAYEAYLRGRYHWNRRSSEGLGRATENFRLAIAKDPTYPAPYAGLADCLSVLGFWGIVSPEEGCGKARGLARNALEMDSSVAEAHASLAFPTVFYDYDFVTAEREFDRSIELDRRYASAHHWLGLYLGFTGRYEEGYTEIKRAIVLDPQAIAYQTLGSVFFFAARRYDQAIEQYGKALEMDPSLGSTHCLLGLAYQHKSMHEQAIAEVRKGVELSKESTFFTALLGEVCAAAGDRDEAERILAQLQASAKQRYVTPYLLARLNASLGRKDIALNLLETAYVERAALMVCLKTDPRFDDLRPDPRFQVLMGRMRFPA